jgi:excisionase family DNA binding protein
MSEEALVFTSSEAMKALNMSKDTFWQLVHVGAIPALKVSERKYLFSKVQIMKWLSGEQPVTTLTK